MLLNRYCRCVVEERFTTHFASEFRVGMIDGNGVAGLMIGEFESPSCYSWHKFMQKPSMVGRRVREDVVKCCSREPDGKFRFNEQGRAFTLELTTSAQRADDVFRALQLVLDGLKEQEEILSRDVLKRSWETVTDNVGFVDVTAPFLRQRQRVAIALDADDSERLTPETSSLSRLLKTVRSVAYRERHGLSEGDLSFYFYAVQVAEEDNGISGGGSVASGEKEAAKRRIEFVKRRIEFARRRRMRRRKEEEEQEEEAGGSVGGGSVGG